MHAKTSIIEQALIAIKLSSSHTALIEHRFGIIDVEKTSGQVIVARGSKYYRGE